jgi:hypothetical protein
MKLRMRKKLQRFLVKLILFVPVHIIVFVRNIGLKVKSTIRKTRKPYYEAKASNIIEGFTNLAVTDPKIETLAKLRAAICGECPDAVSIGIINQVQPDNTTKPINGMKCNKCGCLLNAKVRSTTDYCPVGKW